MILSLFIIISITLGIGLPLTYLILPKHNIWSRLGLAYLLGTGLFTLMVYLLNLQGLKITQMNMLLLVIFTPLLMVGFQFKNLRINLAKFKEHSSLKGFDLIEKLLILGILFFVISSFINTFYWPVYIWDALTLYDFRARVFVETGSIVDSLNVLEGGYYFGYPLLTSILHSVVYVFRGNNPQFLYSFYYLSLGMVFYGLLREYQSRKISMLFTFLLLSIPQIFNQSIVSYTNLPYMTYFSIAAIYVFIWDNKKLPGSLIVSALLLGLSTWTRSAEPLWLGIFGIVILIAIIRKRFSDIFIFSVFFFPIMQIWKNFQAAGLTGTSSGIGVVEEVVGNTSVLTNILNLERWSEVSNYLFRNVVQPWGPVIMLFAFAFIYAVVTKKIKLIWPIYLITFTVLVMIYAGTFIFSFTFPTWHEIPDSASRTAMVVYPLLLFPTALVVRFNNEK